MTRYSGTQSVHRAFTLLDTIASASSPLTIEALIKATRLNRSTIYRLLSVLQEHNYIASDLSGRYYAISHDKSPQTSLLYEISNPILIELARRTGATSLLHLLYGYQSRCIAHAESSYPVRVAYSIGHESPLHAGSSGRVLLTFSPDSFIDRYLALTPLKRITQHTITDPQTLRSMITSDRQRGYVQSHGERELKVSGVGLPILGVNNTLIGGITVLWPDQRSPDINVQDIISATADAARAIVSALSST